MKNVKFKIGLTLLILNFPVGYGGLLATGALAARTEKSFWLLVGLGCYIVSWIMLGLGILLAGTEGVKTAKNLWLKIFKRSKKSEE
jgi:hypothetical protein